jgi:protein TonB
MTGCSQNSKNNKFYSYDPEFIRPKIIERDTLVIPDSIKVKGYTGIVMVECTIDTSGNIIEKKVIKSTNSIFNALALSSVEKYKFKPAIYGGQKIISNLVIPVKF